MLKLILMLVGLAFVACEPEIVRGALDYLNYDGSNEDVLKNLDLHLVSTNTHVYYTQTSA